jgi:HEAT repeat protein
MGHSLKITLAVALLVASVLGLAYVLRGRRAPSYVEPAPDVKHHVREALHGDEPRSRIASIRALGQSSDPSARPALEQAVAQPGAPAPIVAAAVRALGAKKDPRSVPVIARRLTGPGKETTLVRFAAVRALREIGHPDALAALKAQATRDNPVAVDAIWAMGQLQDPKTRRIPPAVEEQLIAYLASPVPKIRLGAIYGLEAGGTELGLAALEGLLKDPLEGIGQKFIDQPAGELPKGEDARRKVIATHCTRAITALRAKLNGKGE